MVNPRTLNWLGTRIAWIPSTASQNRRNNIEFAVREAFNISPQNTSSNGFLTLQERLFRTCRTLGILCLVWIAYAKTAGPLIIFIGPPGAGKTTQAAILQKDRGMALISSDELIEQNHQAFEKFRQSTIQGVEPHVDPVLNRLVEKKLGSLDLSKGVILDGYPASTEQGDYLAGLIQKLGLPKPVIIQLRLPDDVVRKRLKQENTQDIEQRLKDYHREFDFAQIYFPQADIHEVDATKSPTAVAKDIRKVLPR